MFIVGIDVGGTFTDLTAADETTGKVVVTKVPSTPHNESSAVLSGRLAADGTVLTPLDPASVERALDAAMAAGAEAIAVCLLHAYLNPAHERAVADAAKGRYPKLPVSCSADVVAEYREFERFSTTVLNAYLQPIMDSYLAGLEERLRATGYAHGVLTVVPMRPSTTLASVSVGSVPPRPYGTHGDRRQRHARPHRDDEASG